MANATRFGKVVENPNVLGIEQSDEIMVPYDLAEQIQEAIRDSGDANKLETLLNQVPPGANLLKCPTKSGDSLLHLAAELGYAKCARVLLDKGRFPIDISLTDGTLPIHLTAIWAHEICLSFLLEKGADVESRDVNGQTPMHHCALAKEYPVRRLELYVNCIKRLAQNGADINAKDKYEMTPLLLCAQTGHIDIAKCLLKLKAFVSYFNLNQI